MNIIFIGDIVGRLGRAAAAVALQQWKQEYEIDLVIANAENIAHGSGVTRRTLEEMSEAGIDCFTSGNHVFRHKEVDEIFEENKIPLIRPANYPEGAPGCGYRILSSISQKKVCVINLQGRVFMNDMVDNPFTVFDTVLENIAQEHPDVIIVDFHAEATSEKQAFGLYADGRVHAVVGTHTHIQTNDACVLPQQTAYITDVGFVGGKYTVLGVASEGIISSFTTGIRSRHEYPEEGQAVANAVLITCDESAFATRLTPLTAEVTI